MKIINSLAWVFLLTGLAFFVGCEAHSLVETKALHHHGSHDEHHYGEHHGDSKEKDVKKSAAATKAEPKKTSSEAKPAPVEEVKKGQPRSIGL